MIDVFKFSIPDTYIGAGAVSKLPEAIDRLGGKKALIITDVGVIQVGLMEKITAPLKEGKISFGIFDKCQPNAPISAIESGIEMVIEGNYDLIIGAGGGSVMDTAKLVSVLRDEKGNIRNYMGAKTAIKCPGLPRVLIPTTAGSGSEWGRGAIIKDDITGQKGVVHSDFFIQHHVIIDPELTLNLPPRVTGDTGIDALSHAISFYSALNATIVSDMFCEKAIQLVAGNLLDAYANNVQNVDARYNMAVAAAMAIAAGRAMPPSKEIGGRLAHGLAYPLQDMAPVEMTHAVSVSILLPHVMAFDMVTNLDKFAKIAELMGVDVTGLSKEKAAKAAVDAVRRLIKNVHMPKRMRDFGVTKEDIPTFVDHMFTIRPLHVEGNCRKASREDVTLIYQSAW